MPSDLSIRLPRGGSWLPLLGGIVAVLLAGPGARAQTPSFRAFWADAFASGFKSQAQIDTMINRALAGRYNALIVEVLAYHDRGVNGHGAYWNSAIVPKAADISPQNFDPLAYLVQQAHLNNLQVHAWIVSYRLSNTWPPPGNSYLAARPQWLMVPSGSIGGGPAPVAGHYTFDPGSPEVQEYLISIVRELCTNYAIDGINLDYIRYLTTDAGYPADVNYSQSTLARYKALTGYVGTPPPTGLSSWNNFRRRTIDEFVSRLSVELPSVTTNPRQPLWLTADLIAFGNAPTNFNNSDAYVLHQNWRMWMEQGWLDCGIPMNYKREHVANEATWYRNWVNASINWSYDRYICAGVGNYLNTKNNSLTQMNYALVQGVDGTVNYSYAATADENTNGSAENDPNWYPLVGQQIFTQNAPVPKLTWRDPNTATQGVLWGRVVNQLTQQPIENATVTVAGMPSVLTDGNGYYIVSRIGAPAAGTPVGLSASSASCPLEIQDSPVVRAGRVTRHDIDLCDAPGPPMGDFDEDGDVDADDLLFFDFCIQGEGVTYPSGQFCLIGDGDADGDVDLVDFAEFQRLAD